MKTLTLLFVLLLLVGCTPKPKPQHIPPPPSAAPPENAIKPRKIAPGPSDRLVRNCLVTKLGKSSVDCVCRKMSEKIDSQTGAHSLECK